MPKASNDENAQQPEAEPELSKEQLQRQMELTRQSLAETVGEIKQTVESGSASRKEECFGSARLSRRVSKGAVGVESWSAVCWLRSRIYRGVRS